MAPTPPPIPIAISCWVLSPLEPPGAGVEVGSITGGGGGGDGVGEVGVGVVVSEGKGVVPGAGVGGKGMLHVLSNMLNVFPVHSCDTPTGKQLAHIPHAVAVGLVPLPSQPLMMYPPSPHPAHV